jgi:membrane protease YdiL (CAAX protease family)
MTSSDDSTAAWPPTHGSIPTPRPLASSETEPQRGPRALVRSHPLVAYFVLAFLGTWLAVTPLVLSPAGFGLIPSELPEVLSILIFFGATFTGPTMAAFVVSWLEGGGAGVRRFAAGYARWRFAPIWWLVAPLIFPALWLVGYSVLLGGEPLLNLAQDPLVLLRVFLPALVLFHFIPALGEEAGWRGFALPRMERALGPVRATLLLGFLHGMWHLPVFLVAGLLGPFTVGGFATFLLVSVFATFVYTWIANNAAYSILIATLVHAGSNAATNLLSQLIQFPYTGDPRIEWLLQENRLNAVIFGVAALALVAATHGRLGYQETRIASIEVNPSLLVG